MAHSLEGCVSSLRETMSLLGSSIQTLDAGVNDLPRLSKVLQTTRHFELIPEHTLQTAQSSLLSEITPEVNNLLNRVSAHVDRLERREHSLVAKYELQQGRLDAAQQTPETSRPASRAARPRAASAAASQTGQLKMKMLRQKKERLVLAVDRLQLQAGQRERQLRKSMAVPQDIEF